MSREIAFLMEQTLGSVTHHLNLRRAEALSTGYAPRWLPVSFQEGRLPWAVTSSWAARRSLLAVAGEVDGCFVHTNTIGLMLGDYMRKRPVVVSSDATPLNKRHMRGAFGLKPESRLAARAKGSLYRRLFQGAAALVAWSEWAKQSFVEDYGCRESDVAVPRILFVGGG